MSEAKKMVEGFFQADEKTVILPIDHGAAIPVVGLERAGELIGAIKGEVDGFVVNYGAARAYANQLAGKGVCLRTDVYKPVYGDHTDEGSYQVFGCGDAVALGAQAVMNMIYAHHPNEATLARECSALVSESAETGVGVILEALPFGLGRPDDYTVENIGFAVRQAWELGADAVKTAYPGDKEGFADIVAACPVPVVVLGGPAAEDESGLLKMVEEAMDAGARGVAIGRNVWQHADPVGMAGRLKAIVHG